MSINLSTLPSLLKTLPPMLPILFIFTGMSFSYADVHFLALKGVHHHIKPKYQAEVSPVFGLNLLANKSLEHRRFYGRYGRLKAPFGCLDGTNIGAQLVKNNDCPQDYTSEFIQRLFPSQDGVNFVANQIPIDFVSNLRFEVIGKILGKIADFKEQDLTQEKIANKLVEELTRILFSNCAPRSFLKSDTRSDIAKIELELNEIDHCRKSGYSVPGVSLDNLHKSLTEELKLIIDAKSLITNNTITNENGKEGDFIKFATLIVNALREGQGKNKKYPEFLVQHSLLAFFLKKANHKSDILTLFSGMPHLLNTDILKNETPEQKRFQETFINDRFKSSDFNLAAIQSDPNTAALNFAADPEKLLFSIIQDSMNADPLPRVISYGTAKHSSLNHKGYSDCGETSIRNFFNFIVYDKVTGLFNAEYLRGLNIQHNGVFLNLIEFYEKHPDPANAENQEVRDEWSEKVISAIPGVHYLKGNGQCEINVGIDNMMIALDHLFYPSAQGKGPIASAPTRSEKFDILCKLVSRENFDLAQNPKNKSQIDSNNTGVSVEFSISNTPSFKWHFMDVHASFEDITTIENQSWKPEIGERLFKLMKSNNLIQAKQIENLMPNFASHHFIENSKESPFFAENLIYALPFNGNDAKLEVLKQAENIHQPQDRILLVRKLSSRLPGDDKFTQLKIVKALFNTDQFSQEYIDFFKENNLRQEFIVLYTSRVGNESQMEQLYLNSFPMNPKDGYGATPLHYAVTRRKLGIVKFFAKYLPESLNETNSNQETPLHIAADQGNIEIFEFLAQQTPNALTQMSKFGDYPSLLAASSGNWDIVKLIVEMVPKTLHLVHGHDQSTLAHFAARRGNFDLIKYLAMKDPKLLNMKNVHGQLPHELTEDKDLSNTIKELNHKLNFDSESKAPLP